MFGLPLRLKTIATRKPSGETAALVFKPENLAMMLRWPVERLW